MIPRVSDSELGGGGVVHLHIATGPFNCLAFGHDWGVSDIPGPDRRLPQCRAGPKGRLPVPAPAASRFPRAWLLWGMCCRAHFCGWGASSFGCVRANLQRKHVAHVIRDTARPRMHTCGWRRTHACRRTTVVSCSPTPNPSPIGKRSLSIFSDPPTHTLRHTHTCAALYLLGSISVRDRCILSLAENTHAEKASI